MDGEEDRSIDLLELIDGIGIEKLDKYEKYLKSIGDVIDKLNKNGLVDGLFKLLAKKNGMEPTELLNDPLNTKASSNTHKFLFDILNGAPEDVVRNMLFQMMKQQEELEKKSSSAPKGVKKD